MMPLRLTDSFPDSQAAAREALAHWTREGGGYIQIQGTKPQTLAYGLFDSPVGLMSWIAEKFESWTDVRGVSRDDLLTTVMIRMEDAGAIKKWLFHHFMAVAKRVGPKLMDGAAVGVLDRLNYAIGRIAIYGPLRNTLGLSRVRVAYTAGEAIGPEIFRFWRALGVNLKQLYGQTEASPVITQTLCDDPIELRTETVGKPLPGWEVKLIDPSDGRVLGDEQQGELCARGHGVMIGYYKNPEAITNI